MGTAFVVAYDPPMAPTRSGRDRKSDQLARDTHLDVLIAASRFTDEMDQLCREVGLTHHQYVALWVLCLTESGDDGLPIGEIADGLLTRASDTTRLVDRLEKAGLAERFAHPGDRRVVLVRATAAGRSLFAEFTPRLTAYHRSQWANLDNAELALLHRLLGKALWGEDEAPDAAPGSASSRSGPPARN